MKKTKGIIFIIIGIICICFSLYWVLGAMYSTSINFTDGLGRELVLTPIWAKNIFRIDYWAGINWFILDWIITILIPIVAIFSIIKGIKFIKNFIVLNFKTIKINKKARIIICVLLAIILLFVVINSKVNSNSIKTAQTIIEQMKDVKSCKIIIKNDTAFAYVKLYEGSNVNYFNKTNADEVKSAIQKQNIWNVEDVEVIAK